MPAEWFYLEKPLRKGETQTLDGTEFHHLIHVMRGKVGDRIALVNGFGEIADAKILQVEKKQAILILDSVERKPAAKREIILAQAMPRMNRLDFIVEKGTELGMTQLWLFPGKQSERKMMTPHQLDRLKMVTVSAMKQCGRLFLPKIEIKPMLQEWSKNDFVLFYGDVTPSAPTLNEIWQGQDKTKGIIFFIGPEGGFDDSEIATLKLLNAYGVKLHENILRTDTASLTALALLHHLS